MLILELLTIWSVIAIVTAVLAGDTLRSLGSDMPQRRLAVIVRPAQAGMTRLTDNATPRAR